MTKPNLKVQVYLDGANEKDMYKFYEEKFVKGFTTNPTLVAKAGVKDYAGFCKGILTKINDLSISFEVFADEFPEMERQAKIIDSWGKNVFVKIPITNTKKEAALPLIRRLLDQGMKLNVTAIFTETQLQGLREIMKPNDNVIVSIFAGRIADTGIDPMPIMKKAVAMFKDFPKAQVLWASPREVLNVYQANECGCHIITATADLIAKMALYGKDQEEYSLDTVKMFDKDARAAGFQL